MNVVYLSGNWYERKGVLDKMKDSLKPYELSIYNETFTDEYVEHNILSNSCIETVKRLYIIKEWPSSTKKRPAMIAQFKKMLKEVPQECVVVLDDLDFQGDGLAKYVSEFGIVHCFDKIVNPAKAKVALRKRFELYDKKIDNEQIDTIIQSMGSDAINLEKLYSLVLRFIDYVGAKKNITKNDVSDVCSQSSSFIIWDLMNKLDDKDIEGSLSLANKLVNSAKDVKWEISSVISTMYQKYKLLLWVNDSSGRRKSSDTIVSELCLVKKLKQSGMGTRMKMNIAIDDKTEKEKLLFSYKAVSNLFIGFYGRKPSIKCYNTGELLTIISLLEKAQLKNREAKEEAESEIILRVICMAICKSIEVSLINSVLRSPTLVLMGV
jgi:hypothetical protein